MKQIFIILSCLLLVGNLSAQKVKIVFKSGESVKYKVSDLDRIEFQPQKDFDPTNLLSEEYIPDDNFRDWLDTHFAHGNGYYSLADAAAYADTINLDENTTIYDITGIEYFKSLRVLSGDGAVFGNFKVDSLKNLEYLKLQNTKVTELDLSGLTNLQKVFVSQNKLTSLNVAGLSHLTILYCDYNNITNLDLTGCTSLTSLVVSGNTLGSLRLPQCPLQILAAHTNQITDIDLSQVAPTLKEVSLADNQLAAANLSGASRMTYLELSDNPLQQIPNLTGCTNLKEFRLEDIKKDMSGLDFSAISKLHMLRMDNTNLGDSLDLTNNRKLNELSLQACNLKVIDIMGVYNLGYINVSDNPISRLDISASTNIYSLFANRVNKGCQIKVWNSFDIASAAKNGFYTDTGIFVYEFK
jgi:hypothetical protein